MSKPNSKLVETPVESLVGNPNVRKGGPGQYDSESGLPERTSSPNSVPEKIREEISVPKGTKA